MPRSTKDRIKYTDRRKQVAELYLEGWRQNDLADKFTVDQSTISRDLEAIRQEWLQSSVINFNEAKARELTKIDNLEREYWDAWRRSCEDAEIQTNKAKGKVRQGKNEKGEFVQEQPAEVTKTKKGQAGDPRFLTGVEWCISERCKILGIYEAIKHNIRIDWHDDIIDALRKGEIQPGDIRLAYPDLADEFFIRAGVRIDDSRE